MTDLAMMVEAQARRRLASGQARSMTFSVLRPVYPALGCGKLRVLRVRESEETVEIVAGYESYERYDA